MPFNFNWESDKIENRSDLIRLFISIISGLKLLSAALGFRFFTDDFAIAIANLIPLLVILWTVWEAHRKAKKMSAEVEALKTENNRSL